MFTVMLLLQAETAGNFPVIRVPVGTGCRIL